MQLKLQYDKGTLLIQGDVRVPNSNWDARSGAYRALALHYVDIIEYLENSHINFVDEALKLLPVPHLQPRTTLRDYQRDALDSWIQAGKRGTIVLPTGAGKTIVAVGAIGRLQVPTLVIVPTLDLLEQWTGYASR